MSENGPLWHSPAFLGFIAAAIALGGNIAVTILQTRSAERQAHVKAQSDLIVEAIKTGDPKQAAKNLKFLLSLGLLDDLDGKMRAALSHPDEVPYLPTPQSHSGGFGAGGFGTGGFGGPPDKP